MRCPICNGIGTILNKETGYLEFCECVPEEILNIDLNNIDGHYEDDTNQNK